MEDLTVSHGLYLEIDRQLSIFLLAQSGIHQVLHHR